MNKLIVLAMAGFALAVGQAQAAETLKLRLAAEGAYPPFHMVDKDGKLAGFEIDLGNALCAEIRAECVWVQQDWDGAIPGLIARKYDAYVSSMSITEERKKSIAFSKKYYDTPARLVTSQSYSGDVAPVALKGKRIGVQKATTHQYYADKYFAGAGAEVLKYEKATDAQRDLGAGRVDFLFDDVVVLDQFLKAEGSGKFKFIGQDFRDPIFGEGIGVALRKGDTEIRRKFDEAIDAVRKNGTYTKSREVRLTPGIPLAPRL